MVLRQGLFEGRQTCHRGFEQPLDLLSGFHRTLPSVNGLDTRDQIDTSSQLSLNQKGANLARRFLVWKRAENQNHFI